MENVFIDTFAWHEATEKLTDAETGNLMDSAMRFFNALDVPVPIEIRVGGYAVFMSKPKPEGGR